MEYMGRFISLKQFDLVFLQKSNASQLLLRSLLNAILGESLTTPIKQIVNLQSQKSYFSIEQQSSWLIEALTDTDNQVTIRIQVHEHDYFQKQSRELTINNRLDQITSMHQAERFIIHLLNFNLIQESGYYHHRFKPISSSYTSQQKTQQIHYLELPKFSTKNPQTVLEKWLYFICHLNEKQHSSLFLDLVKKDPYFKLAKLLSTPIDTPLKRPILIKEDPLNLTNWTYFGEQQERERIALRMIQSDIPYQQIADFTELTVQQLDELALTIPLHDF